MGLGRLLVYAIAALAAPLACAAPDEELLGKSSGYPVCERKDVWQPICLIGSVSHFHEIHWSRKVLKAPAPRPLKRAAVEPTLYYAHNNQIRTLDEYLARNRTTGLLILKDDVILVERYQYDRKPEHRMNSFSMSKSIVGLLVGIALAEKRIASLDDRADQYVAELKGTAYGETPIRQLLTMSSGVQFVEKPDGTGDNEVLGRATLGRESGGAGTVAAFRSRARPPGQLFNYSSADTQVLGLVLRAATGRNLSDYLAEKIWHPMGAEFDAYWSVDRDGYETAFGFFHATLRDWGRLGMLLANEGALDGRQIIPAAWLREATAVHANHLRAGVATPNFGYGYQFWLFPGNDRRFQMGGVRGQGLYVDPQSKVVMVHTAAREVQEPGYAEQRSFWNSLVIQLGRRERQ